MKIFNFAFKKEVLVRIACDLMMVNACLLFSVFAFFTPDSPFNVGNTWSFDTIRQSNHGYTISFLLMSVTMITTFSLSGFYGNSRTYRGKFKALVVLQAVSLGYLIYSFVLTYFNLNTMFPKNLMVFSWVVTLGVVLASRVWTNVWRSLFVSEISEHRRPLCSNEKSVLVIGGAGYIGSALLPKLLKQGYSVRLLDLFVYGEEPIKEFLEHPRLEVIRADFRQVDKIVEAVKGVHSVVHLGAIVGDPACALNEELTIEVNLMATKMIAEICKGFRVQRFVFASTCSVYGASDDVLDERSTLNPVSLYAKTKIACERVLNQMASDTFSPVNLRFSTIFGLSGRTRFDLVANLLTAKAHFEHKITVFGGDQWRPFLHVDDAAESVMAALKAPIAKIHNEVFNVGSDKLNYTLGQLGQIIANKVPTAELLEMGQDGDRRNYRVSFTKIVRELGFETKWSLEQGVDQVLSAIASGQVLNYLESQFSNAKYLQENCIDSYMTSRYYYNVSELVTA
ncbi:MAG: NAD-dependent epimerase/dehydratase family protein [Pseudomonadota bacterium]